MSWHWDRPKVKGGEWNMKYHYFIPFTATARMRLVGICMMVASAFAFAATGEGRVTRIVIDTKTSPAFGGATFGSAGQYETLAGRIFGELDPNDPHNTIINDIELAPKNANGKVEYAATFFMVKPIDMSKSSHLMWQDVPNRGGRITLDVASRNVGDVGLSSGWRGESSGAAAQGPP